MNEYWINVYLHIGGYQRLGPTWGTRDEAIKMAQCAWGERLICRLHVRLK